MVSSEAVPFIKSGGLADVVGALSASLASTRDEVRIVLPRFSTVSIANMTRKTDLHIPMGLTAYDCTVYETTLPETALPVYFIDNPLFSERPGLYGKSGSHTYRDNSLRFALFCRAGLELLRELSWIPEIIHAHDWQGALITAYMKDERYSADFAATKTVLTLHNIGYQGIFPKLDIHSIDIEAELLSDQWSYGERLNFLKAGILRCDAVTTVSPSYAKEIQTAEFGEGLEKLLVERRSSLHGILNGADYLEWDTENDPSIPASFSHNDLCGKAEAKRVLQEETGLAVREDLPLIGMVSRLTGQKGFGELCEPRRGSLRGICNEMSVQIVILGTGEDWIERELLDIAARHPNLKALISFSNRLAHLIEAGADLFLMPSRYEPCGLNQMYSLRYGTLPIVHRTGGLADTVDNFDPKSGEGTGFVFDDLTPESIYGTTEWAVSTWYEKSDQFDIMRRRAMQRRFSWKESSKRYRELYSSLLSSSPVS